MHIMAKFVINFLKFSVCLVENCEILERTTRGMMGKDAARRDEIGNDMKILRNQK